MTAQRKAFCDNCGNKLAEGIRFCQVCGRPVEGFHKRDTIRPAAKPTGKAPSADKPASAPAETGSSSSSGKPAQAAKPVEKPAASEPAAAAPAAEAKPAEKPASKEKPAQEPPAAAPVAAPSPADEPPVVRIEVLGRPPAPKRATVVSPPPAKAAPAAPPPKPEDPPPPMVRIEVLGRRHGTKDEKREPIAGSPAPEGKPAERQPAESKPAEPQQEKPVEKAQAAEPKPEEKPAAKAPAPAEPEPEKKATEKAPGPAAEEPAPTIIAVGKRPTGEKTEKKPGKPASGVRPAARAATSVARKDPAAASIAPTTVAPAVEPVAPHPMKDASPASTSPTTVAPVVDSPSAPDAVRESRMPTTVVPSVGAGTGARPRVNPVWWLAATVVCLAILAGAAYALFGRKPAQGERQVGKTILTPSGESQSVGVEGRVKVTVPGGMLRESKLLRISELTGPRTPQERGFPLATIARYEVFLGDLRDLDRPIEIEVKCEPRDLDPSQPAGEQILARRWDGDLARWTWVRAAFDEKSGTIKTTSSRVGAFEWVCLTGEPAGDGLAAARWQVYHTPLFAIMFAKQAIEGNPDANDGAWKAKGGGQSAVTWLRKGRASDETAAGYKPGIPLFVQDVGHFLEEAYSKYRNAGFDVPRAPVLVRVEMSTDASKWQDGTADRIRLGVAGAKSVDALRRCSAAELFRAVQHLDYDAPTMDAAKLARYEWWLKATAEYAASRVAWDLKSEAVSPKLLEKPLTETAATVGGEDVGRERSHLIEYLVKRGAGFAGMHKAVAGYGGEGHPILQPLREMLSKSVKSDLPDLYRGFAAYFLFNSDGPIGGVDPSKACAEEASAFPLPKEAGALAEPIAHGFSVGKGYTAAEWSVSPGALPTSPRKIVAECTALSGGICIDVYLIEGNRQVAGVPWRLGTLAAAGDRQVVEVGRGDVVYLVACGVSEKDDGRATVRIIDFGGVILSLEPSEVVNREGRMEHEFTVTARRVPPEVRSVLCEWDFGGRTDQVAKDLGGKAEGTVVLTRSYTFPKAGRYAIRARLFDTTGGIKTLLAEKSGRAEIEMPVVRMYMERPMALAGPDEDVRFDAPILHGPAYPRYEWDFGDGTAKSRTSTNHASHKYAREGEYLVIVRAFDSTRREDAVAEAAGRAFIQKPTRVDTEEEGARLARMQKFTHLTVGLAGKARLAGTATGKVPRRDGVERCEWTCFSNPAVGLEGDRKAASEYPVVWKGRTFIVSYRFAKLLDKDEGSHKRSETYVVSIVGTLDRVCKTVMSLAAYCEREDIGVPNPDPDPKVTEQRRASPSSNWERRDQWGFAAQNIARVSPAEIAEDAPEIVFSVRSKEPVKGAVSKLAASGSVKNPDGSAAYELAEPVWDDSAELNVRFRPPPK